MPRDDLSGDVEPLELRIAEIAQDFGTADVSTAHCRRLRPIIRPNFELTLALSAFRAASTLNASRNSGSRSLCSGAFGHPVYVGRASGALPYEIPFSSSMCGSQFFTLRPPAEARYESALWLFADPTCA